MTYSMKRDDETLKEFIEFYGVENIPNPDHHPKQFEFLFKSFEHTKRMQNNVKGDTKNVQ